MSIFPPGIPIDTYRLQVNSMPLFYFRVKYRVDPPLLDILRMKFSLLALETLHPGASARASSGTRGLK